jgi:acetylornithine/N-succinyldiaminopimelate aminotransferase
MFEQELDNYLNLLEIGEEDIPPEYPFPVVMTSVEGHCLTDEKGNKYLDFTSGRENHPLGYLKTNQEEMFHDSGLFLTSVGVKLEQQLKDLTGLDKAYFTSSRLENYEILADLVKGRGKILVSSSCINQDNCPITDTAVNFIPLNNDSVFKSVFTKSVGAVIIELAQITDEVQLASSEYLRYVRDLCNKNNAILVFDTSALAPMRLGSGFLNYDSSIKPDILIVSKGLSNGIPFGAVLTLQNISERKFSKGSSVLAYRSASKFIDDFRNNDLENIIKSNIKYFEKSLNELAQTHISIVDIYSYGMLFAIVFDISAYELVKRCFDKGIIVEALNPKTIKISPPYFMGKEEIDKLINTLDNLLDNLASYDRLR